jgi:hypothetical protein
MIYIAHAGLLKLNYCGCYKVSDGFRIYLSSESRYVLLYNDLDEFSQVSSHKHTHNTHLFS